MTILVAKKKRRRPWGSPDIKMNMSAASTIITIIALAFSVTFCIPFANASSASDHIHHDQDRHGGSSLASTSLAGRYETIDELTIVEERQNSDQLNFLLEGGGNDEEYQEGEEWEESIDNLSEGGSQYRILQEFDEDLFFEGDLFANGSVSPAEEENVTPTPSFRAGLANTPVAVASMPPASSPTDKTISAPTAEPLPPSPTPVTVTSRAPFEIPLNFNILLRVPKDDNSIDPTDLLRRTEQALEEYLGTGLKRVETEFVKLQTVSLIATFWGLNSRRQLLRGNGDGVGLLRTLQGDEQELDVEVTGAIEFAIEEQGGDIQDPGSLNQIENSLRDKVENELNFLLKEENLDQIGEDVVTEAFGGDVEDQDEQDNADDEDDDKGEDDRNGDLVNNSQVGGIADEDDLEQPTLISIIFGFALLGLATAGLCAYGYICCKKRRKRLRKRQQMKKQMKESIQYKLPTTSNANSVGSKRSIAPSSVGKGKTTKTTPNRTNDAESESSSYNGLGTDSTSVPGDSFARELQLAASLDQQAWDDFQRKKSRSRDSEDRQGAVSATPSADEEAYVAAAAAAGLTVYNARSPSTPPDSRASPSKAEEHHSRSVVDTTGSSSSSRWPRSFPYGDEEMAGDHRTKSAAVNEPYGDDFPDDEGMDWASQDDDEDWDEEGLATSRGSSGKNTTSSFLESSRAMIDRIGKNFEMYGMGTTQADDMEDSNADASRNTASLLTTDIVQEVERLSKFVKRYEMKKERRVKRQQERSHKLGDVSYDEISGNASRSPHDGQSLDSSRENMAHLQNRTPFASSPPSAPTVSNRLRSNLISDAEVQYGSGRDMDRSPAQNQEFDSNRRGFVPDPTLNHDATLSASDSESEVSDRRQVGQERLGITPFSVQKPNGAHHLSYQQERGGSDLENGDARHVTLASLRGHSSALDESKINGHGRGRHSTGGRLSALRSNDAILDSSQSEVGASYPVAYDDTAAIRSTQPSRGGIPRRNKSMPSNRPKHTKKFNNIRAMFEKTADRKDPIFPPDQHWQFTSFAAKG